MLVLNTVGWSSEKQRLRVQMEDENMKGKRQLQWLDTRHTSPLHSMHSSDKIPTAAVFFSAGWQTVTHWFSLHAPCRKADSHTSPALISPMLCPAQKLAYFVFLKKLSLLSRDRDIIYLWSCGWCSRKNWKLNWKFLRKWSLFSCDHDLINSWSQERGVFNVKITRLKMEWIFSGKSNLFSRDHN